MKDPLRQSARIGLAYVLVGGLWIYFSDRAISALDLTRNAELWLQIYKGWGFVLVSGLLVWGLVWRTLRQRETLTDQLRGSEALFRNTFEQAAVGMAQVSPCGDWLRVNRKLCEILGYSPQELMGMTFEKITHPDDLATFLTLMKETLTGRRDSYTLEKRYRHKLDRWFWIQLTVMLVRDEAGEPDYLIAVVEDINERKQAEQATRQARNRLAALISASPLAIVRLDTEGRVQFWNQAAERMFGWSAEEAMDKTLLYIPAEAQDELCTVVTRVVAGQGFTGVRLRRHRRDGEPIDISLSTAPTRAADQSIDGVMAVIEDIGEQLRAEARIHQLNAELEQRVTERTAQLSALNAELEAFSHSVSHDLKAPLRGIEGYSRLLEEACGDNLDEECLTFVANIRRGATQMNDLIEDLLAYSRMERRSLERQCLALPDLVGQVLEEYAGELASHQVEVRQALPPLRIRGDRDGLLLALRNLIGNAIKFSGEQERPLIILGAEASGGLCHFWIQDNGIGFDMRFHDRIFEIFQRLQRAEEYPGTGIGLALVRKALTRMDGRVWAESAPGAGATFHLELPHEA